MTEQLSRRAVLRGGAVVAAGGVVGYAVGASASSEDGAATAAANGYGSDEETGTRLAAVADVPAGSALILAEAKVVLVRGDDDSMSGLSATCTHQGCTVASVEDGVIVCPCHLSRFDLSGAVVSGPAGRPLPAVAVEVRGPDVFTA